MVAAALAYNAGGGPVSALWVVGYFVLLTLGELLVLPIGLSLFGSAVAGADRRHDDGRLVHRQVPRQPRRRLHRHAVAQPFPRNSSSPSAPSRPSSPRSSCSGWAARAPASRQRARRRAMAEGKRRPSWFQRFLLPGFAFKARRHRRRLRHRARARGVLPAAAAPSGGVLAILAGDAGLERRLRADVPVRARHARASIIAASSAICSARSGSCSRSPTCCSSCCILAVFGAAAGEIGTATVRLARSGRRAGASSRPSPAVTTFGNASVERLFKWVTIFLYGVYAIFAVLALSSFGDRVARQHRAPRRWATAGGSAGSPTPATI